MRNNEIIKLGGILFILTFVVTLILAVANMVTAPKIEELNVKVSNEARIAVLENADSFEKVEFEGDGSEEYKIVKDIYVGKNSTGIVGYCVSVAPNGFAGPIDIIVGVGKDKKVTGINIVNSKETPGLGTKAAEPKFKDQYKGKLISKVLGVIKSGTPKDNEISAISGATISSKAVTSGVNAAIKLVNEIDNK